MYYNVYINAYRDIFVKIHLLHHRCIVETVTQKTKSCFI